MNCDTHEADLVDLARGIPLDAPADARLRSHLAGCASCAARLVREQHLTVELKHLSASVPESPSSAAIEEQLLRAFAARRAAVDVPKSPSTWSRAPWWLAAAATVLIGAGVWSGTRPGTAPEERRPETREAMAAPMPPVPVLQDGPRADETERLPQAARPLQQAPASAQSQQRIHPRNVAVPGLPAGTDEVLRFVTLPSSAGLPSLESGRIVRLEVPMAFLPAYGIEVPPEAASRVVEADVLVGQDGQPRAIRFVGPDSDTRRRQ